MLRKNFLEFCVEQHEFNKPGFQIKNSDKVCVACKFSIEIFVLRIANFLHLYFDTTIDLNDESMPSCLPALADAIEFFHENGINISFPYKMR